MAKTIQIDEIHLAIYVPDGLTEQESRAVRRTLLGARFRSLLAQAIRAVVSDRRQPSFHFNDN